MSGQRNRPLLLKTVEGPALALATLESRLDRRSSGPVAEEQGPKILDQAGINIYARGWI
jgi:hypothetical protein